VERSTALNAARFRQARLRKVVNASFSISPEAIGKMVWIAPMTARVAIDPGCRVVGEDRGGAFLAHQRAAKAASNCRTRRDAREQPHIPDPASSGGRVGSSGTASAGSLSACPGMSSSVTDPQVDLPISKPVT
jgi:hypothetical protein